MNSAFAAMNARRLRRDWLSDAAVIARRALQIIGLCVVASILAHTALGAALNLSATLEQAASFKGM